MESYTAIYGRPSLSSKGKVFRVDRTRAAFLCRLVVKKGWRRTAFMRYLKFNGRYQTEDLLSFEYAKAIVDLENPIIKEGFHAEGNVTDGRKRERPWHHELSRDDFYAAYSLSEMSDDEVFDTINLTWSDPERSRLAFVELKHRMDSYRKIAMILELQEGS